MQSTEAKLIHMQNLMNKIMFLTKLTMPLRKLDTAYTNFFQKKPLKLRKFI